MVQVEIQTKADDGAWQLPQYKSRCLILHNHYHMDTKLSSKREILGVIGIGTAYRTITDWI